MSNTSISSMWRRIAGVAAVIIVSATSLTGCVIEPLHPRYEGGGYGWHHGYGRRGADAPGPVNASFAGRPDQPERRTRARPVHTPSPS